MRKPLDLVYRLLEDSQLVPIVRSLEAEQLLQIIDHLGIEDGADLLSLASSQQLTRIFDSAFWKNPAPGEAERFDPEEFAVWLEVLRENGGDAAMKLIVEMDDDLLTLGLANNLLVVDYESLLVRMQNRTRSVDDDLLDKVLDGDRIMEWDDYLIISKSTRAWDTLVAVILAIDDDNPERMRRILAAIDYISTEYIEDNGGLHNVLTSGEMLETDLASDREARREEQGYVSPEAARAFLNQAQTSSIAEMHASKDDDYITRSYFRTYRRNAQDLDPGLLDREKLMFTLAESFPDIYRQLLDAEIITAEQSNLLPAEFNSQSSGSLLSQALRKLHQRNPEQYDRHLQELHYLANILIAGISNNGDRLRPVEAAERVIETCQSGMQFLLDPAGEISFDSVDTLLQTESLVKIFRIGWNLNNDHPLR